MLCLCLSCFHSGTHQTDADVSVTLLHVDSRECLIECSFKETSTANACVIVYWKNITEDHYRLVDFSSVKLEPQEGKAQGSVFTDDGFYHIAVFAYSNDMISGKPIAKFYTGRETGTWLIMFILTVKDNIILCIITRYEQTARCNGRSCYYHTCSNYLHSCFK